MRNCKIFYFFLLLILIFQNQIFAQCIPTENCSDAAGCIFTKSELEGKVWNNINYTPGQAPAFCGTIQNDMWFQIVPDSQLISVTLINSFCAIQHGMQMALYESCNSVPIVCNMGLAFNPFNPLSISAYVTPGVPYLLFVDGYDGDMCEFTFETYGISDSIKAGQIIGQVLLDQNADCLPDLNYLPVADIPVRLEGQYQATYPTTADGAFYFTYSDTGTVTISLGDLPTNLDYWTVCEDEFMVNPDSFPSSTNLTFLLQPEIFCPNLQVELALPPFFRPCWTVPIVFRYCNFGTVLPQGTYVQVIMPEVLKIESTTFPIVSQSGDTLNFMPYDLWPMQCGEFKVFVTPPCDDSLLGQTLCVKAHIYPDSICGQNSNWSGAHIDLLTQCVGDTSVQFILKNTGTAASSPMLKYTVYKNESALYTKNFSLAQGQSLLVEEIADGATWRMEADQEINHPGFSMPAVSLEGCGGLTSGLVNAFRLDDADEFIDQECREVVGSFDPNIKTASPKGIGDEHLIEPNTPLEYIIHFQNTGSDTAFRILLRDVLPPVLDPLTFQPGTSSHPYSWKISGKDTLEVLFSPIILPDSNVNEMASHGWFEFAIQQKPNLQNGTLIENHAAIIFDFNDPIITDPAWHTIGKILVSTDAPVTNSTWRVLGNPTTETCVFIAENELLGNALFELSDAAGRLLQVKHFAGSRYEFYRNSLPSGIYFFRITSDSGHVSSGKIVVQGF